MYCAHKNMRYAYISYMKYMIYIIDTWQHNLQPQADIPILSVSANNIHY